MPPARKAPFPAPGGRVVSLMGASPSHKAPSEAPPPPPVLTQPPHLPFLCSAARLGHTADASVGCSRKREVLRSSAGDLRWEPWKGPVVQVHSLEEGRPLSSSRPRHPGKTPSLNNVRCSHLSIQTPAFSQLRCCLSTQCFCWWQSQQLGCACIIFPCTGDTLRGGGCARGQVAGPWPAAGPPAPFW